MSLSLESLLVILSVAGALAYLGRGLLRRRGSGARPSNSACGGCRACPAADLTTSDRREELSCLEAPSSVSPRP